MHFTLRSLFFFFFFNDTATTEIYTLSLHDALPISGGRRHSRSGPDNQSFGAEARPAPPRLALQRAASPAGEAEGRGSPPPSSSSPEARVGHGWSCPPPGELRAGD